VTRSPRRIAYRLYARRLRHRLSGAALPRHLAIVMDGNRRLARQMGFDDPKIGHRYGAEHIDEVLGWCADIGIDNVSVFVASVDNLRKRDSDEVDNLMRMIEEVVAERLARPGNAWRLHVAGRLDVLPDSTRHAWRLAVEATRDRDTRRHLTVAIGYDGREEIAGAVRSLLRAERRCDARRHRPTADHRDDRAASLHRGSALLRRPLMSDPGVRTILLP
jgi:short-chain Z-isoprenyl diphosphate synthase